LLVEHPMRTTFGDAAMHGAVWIKSVKGRGGVSISC
jgi:hypothetical protein